MHTLGTCGLCAGPVTVPTEWHPVVSPVPKCQKCGAEAVLQFGPLMQMKRPSAETTNKNLAELLEQAAKAVRQNT